MSAKIALTDADIRILGLAWQCFKEKPDVDYKKLCPLVGHTNPASTANAFRAIRKKLDAMAADSGDGATSTDANTPGPSTPTPNSKAKTANTKDKAKNGAGKDKASPTKSTAGEKRKAEDFEVKEEDASDNDTNEPSKPATGKAASRTSGPMSGVGKQSTTATGRMNTKAAENGNRTSSTTPTPKRGNKSDVANKKAKLEEESNDSDNAPSVDDDDEEGKPKKKSNGRAIHNSKAPAKGNAKGKAKNVEKSSGFPLAVDDTKAPVAADQSILKLGISAKDVFPNLRDHSVQDYEGEPIDKHGKGLKHHQKAEIDADGNHRIYTANKDGGKIYVDEAAGDDGSEDGEVKVEDGGVVVDGDLEEDAYVA